MLISSRPQHVKARLDLAFWAECWFSSLLAYSRQLFDQPEFENALACCFSVTFVHWPHACKTLSNPNQHKQENCFRAKSVRWIDKRITFDSATNVMSNTTTYIVTLMLVLSALWIKHKLLWYDRIVLVIEINASQWLLLHSPPYCFWLVWLTTLGRHRRKPKQVCFEAVCFLPKKFTSSI